MKRMLITAAVVAVAGWIPNTALAQSPGEKALAHIKSLAGEWSGKSGKGTPTKVTYELMSAGNYVLERLQPQGEPEMLTIYHLNGSDLIMTHYCAANNQPRMRMTQMDPEGKTIELEFMDATNLSSPAAGHMHALTINLESPDRLSQTWTWREGEKTMTNPIHFERTK